MNSIIEYQHKALVRNKIIIRNKQAINDMLRDMLKVEKKRIKELENQLEWEKKLNKSMMDCIMADGK